MLQEVFLALFQHLRQGKSRANLQGWIFRVAHNSALKCRLRTRREIDLFSHVPGLVDVTADAAQGLKKAWLQASARGDYWRLSGFSRSRISVACRFARRAFVIGRSPRYSGSRWVRLQLRLRNLWPTDAGGEGLRNVRMRDEARAGLHRVTRASETTGLDKRNLLQTRRSRG